MPPKKQQLSFLFHTPHGNLNYTGGMSGNQLMSNQEPSSGASTGTVSEDTPEPLLTERQQHQQKEDKTEKAATINDREQLLNSSIGFVERQRCQVWQERAM
eukprot:2051669-Amphidinium_carterae.2